MLNFQVILSIFLISATFSAIFNAILRKLSKKYYVLIDIPDNKRKLHTHPTPLTGGFAILLGVLLTFFIISNLSDLFIYKNISILLPFLLAGFVCLVTFMIDDIFSISAKLRLFLQSLLVLGLILATDIYIVLLPDLLYLGAIDLGIFGIPFTVFCCAGIMNAFNMIDGLDGLCSAISLNALLFIFFGNISIELIVLIGSISGFILYNIGFFGKKRRIFLGDSGSNFLGLSVAFSCIYFADNISINTTGNISAVTMLWFVAIPLWDCIRVIISRIISKKPTFEPARDHIHHMLLNQNFTPNNTLGIIIIFSFLLGLLGSILENYYRNLPFVSFYCFVFCSLLYLVYCLKLEADIKDHSS
jgi:UDP-GlcNAc:undecaprenyl-phosphate GlcNAc-1-phosphate transferase